MPIKIKSQDVTFWYFQDKSRPFSCRILSNIISLNSTRLRTKNYSYVFLKCQWWLFIGFWVNHSCFFVGGSSISFSENMIVCVAVFLTVKFFFFWMFIQHLTVSAIKKNVNFYTFYLITNIGCIWYQLICKWIKTSTNHKKSIMDNFTS